jgi:RNA polymerase sigma factor (sigma-70 family)
MSPRFTIRPLSAQPDARLVSLASEGDERAFETLVRRHRRALARYCRHLGLSEHRADDVLQQALTSAWLALDRGAVVHEPRAWLYRIVRNTALNAFRGARRHTHESIDAVAPSQALCAAGEIDIRLRARDTLGHVASLPTMQRDAIVMTAIEGRSHEEAAGLLGVSDGAVRGLLYRARTTLRSAAAALSPQGLLGLLTRGGDGVAERTAELSAGGAAAGAAGVLGKGFLATTVAGLLAAGGTIVHLDGQGSSHSHATRRGRSVHVAALPRLPAHPLEAAAMSVPAAQPGSGTPRSSGTSEGGRRSADRHAEHSVRRHDDGRQLDRSGRSTEHGAQGDAHAPESGGGDTGGGGRDPRSGDGGAGGGATPLVEDTRDGSGGPQVSAPSSSSGDVSGGAQDAAAGGGGFSSSGTADGASPQDGQESGGDQALAPSGSGGSQDGRSRG